MSFTFYVTIPTISDIDEPCERCSSLQELAEWLGDGLDEDAPVISTVDEFIAWYGQFASNFTLHISYTK